MNNKPAQCPYCGHDKLHKVVGITTLSSDLFENMNAYSQERGKNDNAPYDIINNRYDAIEDIKEMK